MFKLVWRAAGTSGSIYFILTCAAFGQNCDNVLMGIYDKQVVDYARSDAVNSLQVLEQYNSATMTQAQQTGTDVGINIPIDEVPVGLKFGTHTNRSNQGNWVSQYKNYLEQHNDARMHFNSSFQSANRDVIDAWSRCVVNKKGVILSLSSGRSDLEIVINVQWIPPDLAIRSPLFTALDFDQTRLQLATPSNEFIGKPVPFAQPSPIIFRRMTREPDPVNVIIRTSNSEYTGWIRIRGLPKPSPPLPPTIVPAQIDFDGDRLRDTYQTSGDKITVELAADATPQVTTVSPDFRSDLCDWIQGDFNGDGLTDLACIVRAGVIDPGYVHVFFSKGDGTFYPPTKFSFTNNANPQHDYNTSLGGWSAISCQNNGTSDLVHGGITVGNFSRYYWVSKGNGDFEITSSLPPNCPAAPITR